jgi:hypothetical protein
MSVTSEKKFELKLDRSANVLKAMVQGFFQPTDAESFVDEYTRNVNIINAKDFELQFDCTNLKVSSTEMVPMLTACFEMYKKDEFKKIIFQCGDNASLKMQIRRVANSVGLPNFEII